MILFLSLIIEISQPIYKFLKYYFFEVPLLIFNFFKNISWIIESKFPLLVNLDKHFSLNKVGPILLVSLISFLLHSLNFFIFFIILIFWYSFPFIFNLVVF
ncbi:MAG: hypothetical protein NZ866_00090 [Patescibacteria group bacterium]|nr:hypothetical protein [Patescibacteria group bacterium]